MSTVAKPSLGAVVAVLLVVGSMTSAAARIACVSNKASATARFPHLPACAECRTDDHPPADKCFIYNTNSADNVSDHVFPLSDALNATVAGDFIFVDLVFNANVGPLQEANPTVNGQHLIGVPHATGYIVAVDENFPALTVRSGIIEDMTIFPPRFEAPHNSSTTVRGLGALGVKIATTAAQEQEQGALGQVTIEEMETDYADSSHSTVIVDIDALAVVTWREGLVDLRGPGTAFYVHRAQGLTAIIDARVREYSGTCLSPPTIPLDRWAVQQACDQRFDLVATVMAREPHRRLCSSNPIRYLDANGQACTSAAPGDTLIEATPICGGKFPGTPNALASYREYKRCQNTDNACLDDTNCPSGPCVYVGEPFPCPGTNPNANSLGARWYDTEHATDKVCTATGWKSLQWEN